jgi:hypothetical protein
MVYWYVSIDENVPLSIVPYNNIIFRTYRSFLSSKVLPRVSKGHVVLILTHGPSVPLRYCSQP